MEPESSSKSPKTKKFEVPPKCSQASQTEVIPPNEVDFLGKRKKAEERFDTRSEEWIKKRTEELESVWKKMN